MVFSTVTRSPANSATSLTVYVSLRVTCHPLPIIIIIIIIITTITIIIITNIINGYFHFPHRVRLLGRHLPTPPPPSPPPPSLCSLLYTVITRYTVM